MSDDSRSPAKELVAEVRELTESWMTEYNDERPHNSLEGRTPWGYLAKHLRAEYSSQRRN